MKILLAIDGSEGSRKAVLYVREILKDLANVTATALHVMPRPQTIYAYEYAGYIPEDYLASLDQRAEEDAIRVLEADAVTLREAGVPTDIKLVRGDAATEIVRLAREGGYNLIVIGSRGMGRLEGLLLGSVSDKVAHMAPCPVLIVR